MRHYINTTDTDTDTRAARRRGLSDAMRDRAPLFERTRSGRILARVGAHGSDHWTADMRAAYVAGYVDGCESAGFQAALAGEVHVYYAESAFGRGFRRGIAAAADMADDDSRTSH